MSKITQGKGNMNNKFMNYLDSRYVYHGSTKKDIEVFIPHTSNDVGDDEWNKTKSVYATSNICFAIIFSLTAHYNGKIQVSTDMAGTCIATFRNSFKEILYKNLGYLYIFYKDQFSACKGDQLKIDSKVKPIAMVRVNIQDYLGLGGKIEIC